MRIVFTAVLIIANAFLTFPALAENLQSNPVYREGVHYHALPEPVAVDNPGNIEVVEVFWYGCGHCFHLEPQVLAWQKSRAGDINFVQIPAMWNSLMEVHARAYYTAKHLGILENVHQALYNALNIDQKLLDSPEAVAALFVQFGADEAEVIKVFESPQATAFLKTADAKARAYQITGTPQLIVDGRYRIEASQSLPQSEMFSVVDFLVEKVRAEDEGDGQGSYLNQHEE
jgi:protein dithiol oxidoreductase (disulfide-forming)